MNEENDAKTQMDDESESLILKGDSNKNIKTVAIVKDRIEIYHKDFEMDEKQIFHMIKTQLTPAVIATLMYFLCRNAPSFDITLANSIIPTGVQYRQKINLSYFTFLLGTYYTIFTY